MANRYWVGGTGNWDATSTTHWSASSGGSGGASVPTTADDVIVNSASGSPAISMSANTNCKSLTTTGATCSFSGGNLITVAGGITFSTTTTWSHNATLSLTGTGTITTNGVVMPSSFSINAVGLTITLGSALTCSNTTVDAFRLSNGTINLNGKTLTISNAAGKANINSGTKDITFNGGSFVINCAGATAFNNAAPTGFTTTAGTGTGTISLTSPSAKTFVGGGSTYNCTLNQGGAGNLTITGSNTFTNITNTTQPASVLFTAGTTNTFTDFSLSGTAGNLITIGSVTAATHTLSKASGTVNVNYLSISRSTATGGATWNAGANSTDGGNNTGWIFTAPPTTTNSNFFMLF